MMLFSFLTSSLLVITISSFIDVSIGADTMYDCKYDNFDIDPLINNDRILLSYTKCFLDKAPCTPEGKEFKKMIPDALETACDKCTEKQKIMIRKVIKVVMEKHPDIWKELLEKFDKEEKHREKLQKFLDDN